MFNRIYADYCEFFFARLTPVFVGIVKPRNVEHIEKHMRQERLWEVSKQSFTMSANTRLADYILKLIPPKIYKTTVVLFVSLWFKSSHDLYCHRLLSLSWGLCVYGVVVDKRNGLHCWGWLYWLVNITVWWPYWMSKWEICFHAHSYMDKILPCFCLHDPTISTIDIWKINGQPMTKVHLLFGRVS